MKEKPILFSDPMVRAILDGTKMQTRRVAKPVKHPDLGNLYEPGALVLEREPQHVIDRSCPYGQPGDRLWVREAFAHVLDDKFGPVPDSIVYRADEGNSDWPHGWRPSIHMPRLASRILLEITGVRVERLQEISEADAIAEGIIDGGKYWYGNPGKPAHKIAGPVNAYRDLWESINGPGAWAANPWVWVIEFKRVTP